MNSTPPPIFAETATATWPDGIDLALTAIYVGLILGVPALGYVLMYLDFRRYLRSLRRALVLVTGIRYDTPYWALRARPDCLKSLGLDLPCTEADVVAAYRERAKSQHPDRGGEKAQFLKLQRHYEQALALVRHEQEMN
jgi:hypothetical protein